MSQSLKVFLACALGAFIGALVALQFDHRFWWVGLFAGFGVGYMAYEFKQVKRAASTALRAANAGVAERCVKTWQLCVKACKFWTVSNPEWQIPVTVGFLLFALSSWFLFHAQIPQTTFYIIVAVGALGMFVFAFESFMISMIMALFLVLFVRLGQKRHRRFFGDGTGKARGPFDPNPEVLLSKGYHEEIYTYGIYFKRAGQGFLILLGFLVVGSGKLLVYTFRFLYRILCKTPAALVLVGKFFYHLFRLIHSEVRLLCGTDAAIGAAIGYFCHSAIIGAVAGGLFGVLNFELLSIRFFKFVPKSASIFH